MKLFIVFVFAAAATAKPSGIPVPVPVIPTIEARVSTQYHSQDELGQYSYGYSNAHSAKAETRSLDGLTVGGYTYVDPAGKLQTVEYSSDANGFRVAASNLPVAPAVPAAPVVAIPLPVQDTPEVVEARAKHLEALEAAKVRSAEVATVVQSITPVVAGIPLAPAPLVPAAPVLAVKSAAIVEPAALPSAAPATDAAPSTEAPSTPAPEEPSTTLAPAIEAKSAILPAAPGAVVTPAGVSVLSVPTLAVKSLVAPALPEGVAPVLPAPSAYALNSLYPFGFTSVVAQPALRAYTAQFVASVPGSVVTTSQAWSPTEKAEQRSE